MTHLIIKKKNEVFVTIDSEQYVYHELSDHFTFEVPGAKFMPQYRNKYWDGKIRLYDMRKNEIYTGLVDRVISCLLYTSPSPRDRTRSRMPSSA